MQDTKNTLFGQNLQENTLMTRSKWNITFKMLRSKLELRSIQDITLANISEDKEPSHQVKF